MWFNCLAMTTRQPVDAIVIGAGPNGLAAAITLAQAGLTVQLREAAEWVGGACRTAELTLPGFWHDRGAAIMPLAVASPFIRSLPLATFGLEWVESPACLAHPLDHDQTVLFYRSLERTAAGLGDDAEAYRHFMAPLVDDWPLLAPAVLGPLLRVPRHPLALARFAILAMMPAHWLAERLFRTEPARALWAGLAGHSVLPLHRPLASGAGLLLAIAGHHAGWPFPRGGAQRLSDALAAYLTSLGGTILTNHPVTNLEDLPPARAILCDLAPRHLVRLAGHRLPTAYRRRLLQFRHGPGVFKLDWALDGPIPWRSADCRQAATVHLGGGLTEIATGEAAVWRGVHPTHPYVLLTQPSLFDESRAPAGQHVAWAYCHVPAHSTVDMTEAIEQQVERYAPGFRRTIIGRRAHGPQAMELFNQNLIGGDISGGVQDLPQMLARPIFSPWPYATPLPELFLCSSSTPPGGGVHGMSGYQAARLVLTRRFGRHTPPIQDTPGIPIGPGSY